MKLEVANKKGEPTILGYIFTGIVIVILLALAGWLLWSAFFGWLWLRIVFWSIVSILAIIGAFYGIGKLFFWIKEEF